MPPDSSAIQIHKFGGTSVGSADRIRRAAELVQTATVEARLCVVSSAMSGVTNRLVALTECVDPRESARAVEELRSMHEAAADGLGIESGSPHRAELQALLDELDALASAMLLTRAISEPVRDRLISMGERLAVRLLAAACAERGLRAQPVDADTFLETSAAFGETEPLSYTHDRRTRSTLLRMIEEGVVPIVTGFVGRGPEGDARLLGRGGSDLTATLLASALEAESATIWTDVPGVWTCDPRIVPDAQHIPHLHYREAGEMAFFGSKVLHPRTMIPVARAGIPVLVRSTIEPEGSSTRIDGTLGSRSDSPLAVAVLRGMALLTVEGAGLAGVAGVSARIFTALAGEGVSVVMISQGSSESSVCLGLHEADLAAAERALRTAFMRDIAAGGVGDITGRRGVSILTAVGSGMKRRVGAASAMTAGLARAGVNILAIAQGASELSVSFAVDAEHTERGARGLHESLREQGARLSVLLAGFGNVARAVAQQIDQHEAMRLVGICDSSGFVFDRSGMSTEQIDHLSRLKSSGGRLAVSDGAQPAPDGAAAMLEHAIRAELIDAVLVDCTAAPQMVPTAARALGAGIDVVAANKEIPACSTTEHDRILDGQRAGKSSLLCEATVGAGIPIAHTLQTLSAAGDEVTGISASLSGTLGFLLAGLAEGSELGTLVPRAIELGFAEPDPSADLLGLDVERKAITLCRLAHFPGPVHIDRVAFADVAGIDPSSAGFAEALARAQSELGELLRQAEAQGGALRYLLDIKPDGRISIGPRVVDPASPFFSMRAEEARVVIYTARNGALPLVLSGPGAGAVATAGGVMADLCRLAAMRRGGLS